MLVEIAHHHERPIRPKLVVELDRSIGWWPERTEADFRAVLGPTAEAIGAWSQAHLMGLARAISDGRMDAYVDDVMVHPEWRRRGLALAMVNKLVEALDVRVTTLFCSSELVSVYEKEGFVATRQVLLHRSRKT